MTNAAPELRAFAPWVQKWFGQRFGQPTLAQALGWPPIIAHENALLLAPTGSGKTLAAFLWGIDSIYRELGEGTAGQGVRLLYVSPLKALSNDIERNLREPLAGVRAAAAAMDEHLPALHTAVRTGDTPNSARVRMTKQPPHILITTPESLYLMLTSRHAGRMFSGLRTVIVDEIHSLAGNKRGVHLALSLERLERVAGGPVQRIGLSATQRPMEEIARFLGGQIWAGKGETRRLTPRPVTIIDAGWKKSIDLQVVTVVPNFGALPDTSIWPSVVEKVVELIRAHRTTLIFANSRRLAERFSELLNQHFGPGVIRAHHGSMSKEVRHELEQALKDGRLPALVGTSSLELGIDIGSVDLVVQLQSPKGVTQGLQRVGRSGHLVGQTSVGRIFATFPEDLMESAVIARQMLVGEVEPTHTPRLCLDVLAQQIVAAVATENWEAKALWDLFRQAYPYQELTWKLFSSVLEMMSGRYPAETFRELRARIGWDRVNGRLAALPGSSRLALTSGGTIPDTGAFGVYLPDGTTKIGELDEEFVFESREGEVFTLGTHTWRAERITDDRVIVSDASGAMPRLPFWRGEYPWRNFEVGLAHGRFRREVAARLDDPDAMEWLQQDHRLDERSARNVLMYVRGQVETLGAISSDETVILELFHDSLGDPRLVIHSPFGGRVNGAWALALAGVMRSQLGFEAEVKVDDDGILLRFPDAEADPPLERVASLTAGEARERIMAELPGSAAFGAQFRRNAARALLLPGLGGRRRTPFWLQRLRARDLLAVVRGMQDFPIVTETVRDCLRDVFDLEHLEQVLRGIEQGRIEVVAAETISPSPLARGLLADFIMTYMYSWDAPKAEKQMHALALSQEMLDEVLEQPTGLSELLQPEALEALEARLQHRATGFRARSAEELAQTLLMLGDLSTAEIHERSEGDAGAWLAELARDGRVVEIEIPTASGPARRWVATESADAYRAAFERRDTGAGEREEASGEILRWFMRTHGPATAADIDRRYAFDDEWLRQELEELVRGRALLRGQFTRGAADVQWADRENLRELHRRSLAVLRRQVEPVSLFTYTDFLTRYQHLHPAHRASGSEGLRQVLDQLRGFRLPAGMWERESLPERVNGYAPELLDEQCESGDFVWIGQGSRDHLARAQAAFIRRGEGSRLYGEAEPETELSPNARQILEFMKEEGACFRQDVERVLGLTPTRVQEGLIDLGLAGFVTNDNFGALRNLLGHRLPQMRRPLSALEGELSARAHERVRRMPTPMAIRDAKRVVRARLRAVRPLEGRWSLVRRTASWGRPVEPVEQVEAWARLLLLRYGILLRHCLAGEECPWTWSELYHWLQRMEMRGEVRRGYFVEGLPGAQFGLPEAVESLRDWQRQRDDEIIVLNACDPANVFTPDLKALPTASSGEPLVAARQASAYYVMERGRPCLAAEGSRVSSAADAGEDLLRRALRRMAAHVVAAQAPGLPRRFRISEWNGVPVLASGAVGLLESASFHRRMRDMVWWQE